MRPYTGSLGSSQLLPLQNSNPSFYPVSSWQVRAADLEEGPDRPASSAPLLGDRSARPSQSSDATADDADQFSLLQQVMGDSPPPPAAGFFFSMFGQSDVVPAAPHCSLSSGPVSDAPGGPPQPMQLEAGADPLPPYGACYGGVCACLRACRTCATHGCECTDSSCCCATHSRTLPQAGAAGIPPADSAFAAAAAAEPTGGGSAGNVTAPCDAIDPQTVWSTQVKGDRVQVPSCCAQKSSLASGHSAGLGPLLADPDSAPVAPPQQGITTGGERKPAALVGRQAGACGTQQTLLGSSVDPLDLRQAQAVGRVAEGEGAQQAASWGAAGVRPFLKDAPVGPPAALGPAGRGGEGEEGQAGCWWWWEEEEEGEGEGDAEPRGLVVEAAVAGVGAEAAGRIPGPHGSRSSRGSCCAARDGREAAVLQQVGQIGSVEQRWQPASGFKCEARACEAASDAALQTASGGHLPMQGALNGALQKSLNTPIATQLRAVAGGQEPSCGTGCREEGGADGGVGSDEQGSAGGAGRGQGFTALLTAVMTAAGEGGGSGDTLSCPAQPSLVTAAFADPATGGGAEAAAFAAASAMGASRREDGHERGPADSVGRWQAAVPRGASAPAGGGHAEAQFGGGEGGSRRLPAERLPEGRKQQGDGYHSQAGTCSCSGQHTSSCSSPRVGPLVGPLGGTLGGALGGLWREAQAASSGVHGCGGGAGGQGGSSGRGGRGGSWRGSAQHHQHLHPCQQQQGQQTSGGPTGVSSGHYPSGPDTGAPELSPSSVARKRKPRGSPAGDESVGGGVPDSRDKGMRRRQQQQQQAHDIALKLAEEQQQQQALQQAEAGAPRKQRRMRYAKAIAQLLREDAACEESLGEVATRAGGALTSALDTVAGREGGAGEGAPAAGGSGQRRRGAREGGGGGGRGVGASRGRRTAVATETQQGITGSPAGRVLAGHKGPAVGKQSDGPGAVHRREEAWEAAKALKMSRAARSAKAPPILPPPPPPPPAAAAAWGARSHCLPLTHPEAPSSAGASEGEEEEGKEEEPDVDREVEAHMHAAMLWQASMGMSRKEVEALWGGAVALGLVPAGAQEGAMDGVQRLLAAEDIRRLQQEAGRAAGASAVPRAPPPFRSKQSGGRGDEPARREKWRRFWAQVEARRKQAALCKEPASKV